LPASFTLLVISLFVMAACKHPRSPGVRRIGYLVVLLAIGFTGSNGAMLTLLVGLVLAFWGIRLLILILPEDFPNLLRHIQVDGRVLAFTAAVSCSMALSDRPIEA
jgi:hypothetical protein